VLKRASFIAFALTGLVLAGFQNCGGMMPGQGFKAQTSMGGEGYDGKPTFINFGECNGQVAAKTKIQFAQDMQSAEVTRSNCQDLNTPAKVDLNQVQLSMQDNGVFVYGGDIFDLQRKSLTERKVTKRLCWTTAAGELREAAIWFLGDAVALNTGFVPTLKGYARRQSGAAWTGKLGPITETQTSPGNYTYTVAPNENGDTMTLTVDQSTDTGTLAYTMSDPDNGEMRSGLAVKCYSQLEPQ
jgi:hypothetical protein